MFRFASLVIFTLLLYSQLSESVSGPHIADVNILLPPKMTHPVEYRLQGSDGCFQWSWDHHDILAVQPEYNLSSHCSTSARLSSIAPYSGRKETAVYAADVLTGIVIRCKVFIDIFSRIQIFHSSIKLDLDGLATLQVRAFDSEDNLFSSLVGLQFMWKQIPEIDGLPNHLVHVPLKDSPLSDCGGLCGDLNIQIKVEDSGAFSDLYVVKGTKIGHEIVSVHLSEPQFEHMEDKILLTVAEAMSIEPPSPVLVIIGAVVHYTLKVMRGNLPQVVQLPSPYYRWSVLNSSVAKVDTMVGSALARSLGATFVKVEDTRVAGHVQISSLHVVVPDALSLYILPLSLSGDLIEETKAISSVAHWYVVSGRQYLINMKVFSQGPGAQEIYITETDDIKLHYDQSDHWYTFLASDNITFKHGWRNCRILKATSHGLGKLTASLSYYSGYSESKEVLKVVQEIMVCDQVKFSMRKRNGTSQSILLPWAPAVYQEVELKTTGGCAKTSNDYKWFSSDMATVSVSASGVAQAKKLGVATVRVVSIFDPLNYDEVVVEVSVPSFMVMLESLPVETVVGSHLQAAVAMKSSTGAYFYRCDAFNPLVRWKSGSEYFILTNSTKPELAKLYTSPNGPPCAWTTLYASGPGQAVLSATLSTEYQPFEYPYIEPILLKAAAQVAAYLPLIVCQAGDGNQFGGYSFDLARSKSHNQSELLDHILLAPKTHLDVMLLGGPEKWFKGVEFIETLEILDMDNTPLRDGVYVKTVPGRDRNVYRISCEYLGSFELVFKRGNLAGDHHPLPVVEEVELVLECRYPSSIALIADEPVNAPDVIRAVAQADYKPGHIRSAPITVANGRTIRIAAVGLTDSGKAFANSSSLHLRWELSGCDGLAFWDDAWDYKSSWERFLVLEDASGWCVIRATVTNLLDSVSGPQSALLLERSENAITDAIRLQLVSTLGIAPEFSLLFFSTEAKVNLSITGGSCFLHTVINDSQVVEVVQATSDLRCSQLTLAPKGLGCALLTVYDVNVSPPLAASSVVEVADIDWIKITSHEDISLMQGSSESIDLLAGVSDGRTFGASQYVYMDIHVHIEGHLVELLESDGFTNSSGRYVNKPKFTIQAKHVGFTTIYVSARQHSGDEIMSQPVKVEVYAPPQIHPHDLFLAPGASYVVIVRGGPTTGFFIEYESLDNETATVHKSSGQLTAISPGNTTLLATIYGRRDVLICQAYGRVTVGVPSSIILHVQSEQLGIGHEMPIFPSLPEGNLFSFYDLCKNYKWTVDQEKILSFKEGSYGARFDDFGEVNRSGYLAEKDFGFINLLHGRSAGTTDVRVSFSCSFTSAGSLPYSRSYIASLSIRVVPDLPLALGVPMTWILPPHYTTSNLLPSFSESYSQLDSQSHEGGNITYSLLSICGAKNKEDAISIDGYRIKTKDSNNLACIQAEDQTTGKVEIASCVKVSEVAQIRITRQYSPFHVIDLAVGDELELSINYRDSIGNLFHEAYNIIHFDTDTNYPNVVSVNAIRDGNGKILLKAISDGRALLRISIKSTPEKSDYMLISVGAHLYLQNPVLPRGNIIFIDALPETVTNVPFPMKGYNFSVRFSDYHDHKFEAPGGSSSILHDCKVDPPYIGYTKPWRDIATGNSYCLFFPYSPEHLVHSIRKSRDMRKDISLTITASLRGAGNFSASTSAFFVGGFSILEIGKLNFTPSSDKRILTIIGNTDVEFHWHHQDLLLVKLIQTEDFGIGSLAKFEVNVLKPKRFNDKIIIMLPANGQRIEVDVNYEPGEIEESMSSDNVNLWIGVLGCFSVLVITVAIFICFLDRPKRSRSSIPPATSSISAPVTPDRNPPVLSNEESPRTPQPFIEYVRQTIDETPFYRREGRRRFNPKNTF